MIVNTEWGAFGNQGELDFILTKWDREVDKLSINPGKQIFEKMISGMYMGEVVRQVLIDLVHEGLMFVGQNTENLFQHGRYVVVWHIFWCFNFPHGKKTGKSGKNYISVLDFKYSLNEEKVWTFLSLKFLREINFDYSMSSKNVVFTILVVLNFVSLVNFSIQKVQKFIKIKIQSL